MSRLAIFDCDGTLVDSGATIYSALGKTFRENGLEVPSSRVARNVIGLSLNEAMAVLLPGASTDVHARLAEDYKRAFSGLRAAGLVEEPLFEGIPELLDELEADGWLLAVATGKSDRGLNHCLDLHGIRDRFISLQTADRHPSKPHPSMVSEAMAEAGAAPSATIVIGDTSFDMAMAAAAGATPIGAGWGYHEPAELIEAGAVAVADTPSDVLSLIAENVHG
jgi:phosphoglycolate phosphatase